MHTNLSCPSFSSSHPSPLLDPIHSCFQVSLGGPCVDMPVNRPSQSRAGSMRGSCFRGCGQVCQWKACPRCKNMYSSQISHVGSHCITGQSALLIELGRPRWQLDLKGFLHSYRWAWWAGLSLGIQMCLSLSGPASHPLFYDWQS